MCLCWIMLIHTIIFPGKYSQLPTWVEYHHFVVQKTQQKPLPFILMVHQEWVSVLLVKQGKKQDALLWGFCNHIWPRTGDSVGWALGCHAGGCEFDCSQKSRLTTLVIKSRITWYHIAFVIISRIINRILGPLQHTSKEPFHWDVKQTGFVSFSVHSIKDYIWQWIPCQQMKFCMWSWKPQPGSSLP